MSLSLYFSQLLLLGDSITQDSVEVPQGVVPQLQKEYVRKYDVVNRGFAGYNTDDYLEIVEPVLNGLGDAPVDWSVVFLGNEDAQTTRDLHVPLSQYSSNLRSIAEAAVAKSNNVVVVGQGIVDEDRANATNRDFYLYNRAARDVAQQLDLPFVDLWGVFRSYLNESSSLNPFTFGANGSNSSNSTNSTRNATSGASNRTLTRNATFANSTNSTNVTAPANATRNGTSGRNSTNTTAFIGAKGNPQNRILTSLLTDGLHYTDLGYQLYVSALQKVLNTTNVTQVLPDYTRINSTETLPNAIVQEYVAVANSTAQRWLNKTLSS